MTDDPTYTIILSLNAISRIVDELPAIGKRSELSQKASEINLLLDEAKKAAQAMEKEIISLKYEYPAQRFERQKGVKRG
jgi:hypothetical protein